MVESVKRYKGEEKKIVPILKPDLYMKKCGVSGGDLGDERAG